MKIVVIGAGFGGLTAAAYLAKAGHQVTVLEKNDDPGGKASIYSKSGFTFDMGPSWYMMPDVIEDIFTDLDRKITDYLKLTRLDPNYRVFFEDHTHLDIPADKSKALDLFESVEPGAATVMKQYLSESALKYSVAKKHFLYQNLDYPWQLINSDVIANLPRIGLFSSMESHTNRLFQSPKLRKILQFITVFLGTSPSQTPALYSMMSHLDFDAGVYYPQGGLHQVAVALEQIAKEWGANFLYNQSVSSLQINRHRISQVITADQTYTPDLIISNADYPHTESLFSDSSARQYSPKYWQQRVWSPSAFILYLGVSKPLPQLLHHNLFFTDNWQEHFQTLKQSTRYPDKPCIYIGNPNKSQPDLAPPGCENLFVLVPISTGIKESTADKNKYADQVISWIERQLDLSLTDSLIVKDTFSVSDFASRYNNFQGQALGLGHTLNQTAMFRPKNVHAKVENLFFSGSSTTPGIGVPTCMISGKLVFDRINSRH